MEETRKKVRHAGARGHGLPSVQAALGSEGQEHLRREYEAQGHERKDAYQGNESKQQELNGTLQTLTAELSQQEAEVSRARSQIDNKTAVWNATELSPRKRIPSLKERPQSCNEWTASSTARALPWRRGACWPSWMPDWTPSGTAPNLTVRPARRSRHWKRTRSFTGRCRRQPSVCLRARRPGQDPADARPTTEGEGPPSSRIDDLHRGLKDLPARETALKDAESLLQKLEGQRQQLLVQVGVLENSLERCVALGKGAEGP